MGSSADERSRLCGMQCNDASMKEIDPGELERLASALRLAESALEEALEAAENLGSFDRRFDVPRAVGGAQRLVGNALEAVDAARRPGGSRRPSQRRTACAAGALGSWDG